jgi:chromosome segregation ATPase
MSDLEATLTVMRTGWHASGVTQSWANVLSAEFEALRAERDELSALNNKLAADNVNLHVTIRTMSDDAAKKFDAKNATINELRAERADLIARRDELNVKNTLLEGKVNDLRRSVEALRAERDELSTAFDGKMKIIGMLESEVESLRAENDTLNAENMEIIADNNKLDELQTAYDAIVEAHDTLYQDLTEQEIRNDFLEGQIDELGEKIEMLEAANKSLQAKIEELTHQRDAERFGIRLKQQQIESLKAKLEVPGTSAQVEELHRQINNLRKWTVTLNKETEQLQDKCSELDQHRDALRTRLNEVCAERDALRQEVLKTREESCHRYNLFTEQTIRCGDLQNEIGELRAENLVMRDLLLKASDELRPLRILELVEQIDAALTGKEN